MFCIQDSSKSVIAGLKLWAQTLKLDFLVYIYRSRFLGYVDKIGVAYEAPSVASGYGAYIAQVCNNCVYK